MTLHHYPEAEGRHFERKDEPGTEARAVADGLHVDLNGTGEVVGFDSDGASRHRDLTTLATVALPPRATRAA
jgi:uncharacterized protein YuzE